MQWEDYVFAVRTDRYKLTWYAADDAGELYDLEADPLEVENLYQSADHSDVRNELLGRLDEWRERYARREDLPTK
jgi:arylsulfatase A-like enzyme